MSTYLMVIPGFAFSKAGMISFSNASFWALLEPAPYVPHRVSSTVAEPEPDPEGDDWSAVLPPQAASIEAAAKRVTPTVRRRFCFIALCTFS